MFIRFEMIHERDRQTDRRTDGQTPRAGIYRAQMPSSTSELGDRQSSRPVKTLLQYYGKSLEALPGVAYPGFRDNRSTLNTKTGFKKKYIASLIFNLGPNL